MPGQLEGYWNSVLSLSFFSSNIFFWSEASSYFHAPSLQMPLLHTWSLSLEMQFYLLFPILIHVVIFFRSNIYVMLFVGMVASLIVAEWASLYHPHANYFLLPSRLWEFLMGAITYLFSVRANLFGKDNRLFKNGVSFVAIAAITLAVITFDSGKPLVS